MFLFVVQGMRGDEMDSSQDSWLSIGADDSSMSAMETDFSDRVSLIFLSTIFLCCFHVS